MTGNSWPRWWQRAGSVAACVAALQAPATPVAECTVMREDGKRVYQVVDRGPQRQPQWWLTLALPGQHDVIELPLADARVERSATRVTVSSASRNGGLSVEIDANADKSTVHVFVNFELEVNVWRDLSPDVEHMNTEGSQTGECRLLPAPAR